MVSTPKSRRMVLGRLGVHAVTNIQVDETDMGMLSVHLQDGKRLTGINNARMQLAPDEVTVRLVLEIVGPITINGKAAKEVFAKAAEKAPKVEALVVPPHRGLVGPDGRMLT